MQNPRTFPGAPATLILAVIAIVGLLSLNGMPQLIERHLLRPYQLVPRRQWHTLVTSGFIHADLAHLLFNAFSFWAFGFDLERALGTPAFVLLYAFSLLASSPATWAIHRTQPGYSSLGASGAILAVVFAAIVVNRILAAHPADSVPDSGTAVRRRLSRLQRAGRAQRGRAHQPRCACSGRGGRADVHGARRAGLARRRARHLAQLSAMLLPLPDRFEAPRLLVRPVQERDLPALLAVNGDAQTVSFLPHPQWGSLAGNEVLIAAYSHARAGGTARQYVAVLRAGDEAVAAC